LADWNITSPLLADMQILSCLSDVSGISTYLVSSIVTEKQYIFKNISIPESQTHVDGLRYSGAIKTSGDAQAYYSQVAGSYRRELEVFKELAELESVDCYPTWHIQPKDEAIGFDIQMLCAYRQTLTEHFSVSPMTQKRAVKLGLDICRSLTDLRGAGYVHCNVKPNNIYLDPQGRFILGGLGIFRTDQLKFAAVPERMLGKYAAPELFNVMQTPNATVDIYSLGLILYNVYNGGHNPFEDEQTSANSASEKRISGIQLPAPIFADYEMADIILKACAYDPADRYQSPEELFDALQAYADRNEPQDTNIVPPIIADDDLLLSDEAINEEMQPMHFARMEELGEEFVHHFAPAAEVLNESLEAVQASDAAATASDVPEDDAPDAADTTSPEDPVSLPAENPEPAQTVKKSPLRLWIAGAAGLALLLGLAAYFALVPRVSAYSVKAYDSNSIVLSLDTHYPLSAFSATCVDSYGHSFRGTVSDDTLAFEGLDPGTQYTVQLKSSLGLNIRGKRTFTCATALATEVTFFVAKPISESEVELSFEISGRDQESWTVSYGYDGAPVQTVTFHGHSVRIKDLSANCIYTFSIQNSDAVDLSGQTQVQYDTTQQVEVMDFSVAYDGNDVTLTWDYLGRTPQSWSVMYTEPDGTRKELSTTEPKIVLDALQPKTEYIVELFTAGMSEALQTKVYRNVAHVDKLVWTTEKGGVITVNWESGAEISWKLNILLPGSEKAIRSITTSATYTTVSGLVPNAEYAVVLVPANGWAVSGEYTTTIKTGETAAFDSYNCTSTYLGIFSHPGTSGTPTANDLREANNIVRTGDSIAFALEALSKISRSSDKVLVSLVLRRADGSIAMQTLREASWDNLWSNRLFVGELRNIDQPAGTYEFEIYINHGFVNSRPIIVQ